MIAPLRRGQKEEGIVAHTFNTSILEAEAVASLSSKPARGYTDAVSNKGLWKGKAELTPDVRSKTGGGHIR